jgi:beta-glucosidase
MGFAKNFVWGVATSAYQIEGASAQDGGGESVWDMFCRKPNAVWSGHTGAVACDHYHRYRDDVALMRALGVQAYRFSLSWPRILPEGTGKVNAAGLDFYDRLVDALLAAGITPWTTLFHWDYPSALFNRGGWLNRESADWFAEYTRVVVERLSDRVTNWMTINEPQCFLGIGHRDGTHAPGLRYNWRELLLAVHHGLLAHGKAVQVLRAHAHKTPRVGVAPVGVIKTPASDSPADIEAARTLMFSMPTTSLWNNAWWIDPMLFGRYPEDGLAVYGADAPRASAEDFATIQQPLDFFGANIYNGETVRAGANGEPEIVPEPTGHPLTMFHWSTNPATLYWGPRFYWERYGLPIVITENGMANTDWPALDGKIHDPQRIDFLNRYLLHLERAADDGVPIEGYFQWSFMDNFEWADGYKMRFGLIYVDYETQQRIPKDSAYWYREVMRTNGAALHAGTDAVR